MYEQEVFSRGVLYGQDTLVVQENAIADYLDVVLSRDQIEEWLLKKDLARLALKVIEEETQKVKETWMFELFADLSTPDVQNPKALGETFLAFKRELLSVVGARPVPQHDCTFEILIFDHHGEDVTDEWNELLPEEDDTTTFSGCRPGEMLNNDHRTTHGS